MNPFLRQVHQGIDGAGCLISTKGVQRFNDEGVTYDKRPSPQEDCIIYIYIRMLRDFLHTHTYIYICTPCRVRLKRTRKTLPPVSGSVVEFQQWLEDHLHQSFKNE